MEAGRFDVEIDGHCWRLVAGDIQLIHPGMRFRVAHHDGDPSDVFLSVSYADEHCCADGRGRGWRGAQSPVLLADNRLRYLYRGLRHALDVNRPMLAETCAAALLRDIRQMRASSIRGRRPRTFEHHARRIRNAQERLDADPAASIRLDTLAREVGMSTFHFARVFAELVGLPPHQSLLDARPRMACSMLAEGRSVPDTCFAYGFNDVAHFSRLSAGRYGHPPSIWRSA